MTQTSQSPLSALRGAWRGVCLEIVSVQNWSIPSIGADQNDKAGNFTSFYGRFLELFPLMIYVYLVRRHGVSVLAAVMALAVSLLLVNRGEQGAPLHGRSADSVSVLSHGAACKRPPAVTPARLPCLPEQKQSIQHAQRPPAESTVATQPWVLIKIVHEMPCP